MVSFLGTRVGEAEGCPCSGSSQLSLVSRGLLDRVFTFPVTFIWTSSSISKNTLSQDQTEYSSCEPLSAECRDEGHILMSTEFAVCAPSVRSPHLPEPRQPHLSSGEDGDNAHITGLASGSSGTVAVRCSVQGLAHSRCSSMSVPFLSLSVSK